jgi:hypothetical protein
MRIPVQASGSRKQRSADGPPLQPDVSPERLQWLIRRISDDDRDAFVELFDHLSPRLLDALRSRLSSPCLAAAIVTATFVEVWWLAGCHAGRDSDVVAWIDRIAQRRVGEGPPATTDVSSLRNRCAELELAALLGRSADTPR